MYRAGVLDLNRLNNRNTINYAYLLFILCLYVNIDLDLSSVRIHHKLVRCHLNKEHTCVIGD
jgi:hypothetical protein